MEWQKRAGQGLHSHRRVLLIGVGVVAIEMGVTLVYLSVQDWTVLEPRYLADPWTWINAALVAAWVSNPVAVASRQRVLAGVIAGGYFLVLSVVTGILEFPGHGHAHLHADVIWLPPAWGPVVLVATPVVSAVMFPYEVVGYGGYYVSHLLVGDRCLPSSDWWGRWLAVLYMLYGAGSSRRDCRYDRWWECDCTWVVRRIYRRSPTYSR